MHFIITLIMFLPVSRCSSICALCFDTETSWVMVYVVTENIVVCILYRCGKIKKQPSKHFGVSKHNAQLEENSPYYMELKVYVQSVYAVLWIRQIPSRSRHDCLTPCVSLDFSQAKSGLFGPAVACNRDIIHLLSFWGVWMSHMTCVHKVFIFYKDWMFILSKVWACECQKKNYKRPKHYNCTVMRVYSCVRGVEICAVNQRLYVQPCPVNGWNISKGEKNRHNFNLLSENLCFGCCMFCWWFVSIFCIQIMFKKRQNMYRFICMLTVKKYACKIVLFFHSVQKQRI